MRSEPLIGPNDEGKFMEVEVASGTKYKGVLQVIEGDRAVFKSDNRPLIRVAVSRVIAVTFLPDPRRL